MAILRRRPKICGDLGRMLKEKVLAACLKKKLAHGARLSWPKISGGGEVLSGLRGRFREAWAQKYS